MAVGHPRTGGLSDCEPTAEAVLAARNALPLQELANGMWRDQNSETLLIDYGFRGAENYTPEEMRATFNQQHRDAAAAGNLRAGH